MKRIILLLFILDVYTASSQKHMMKVDDSLKANSEFMEAKRKSIGASGKYEFGPYKIISAKKGIVTTKTKSKFLNNISESESKQASSFVFIANDKDTVEANLLFDEKSKVKNSKSLILDNGKMKSEPNEPEIKEDIKTFTAIISPVNDTVEWRLGYVGRFNSDSSDFHSLFLLSDGKAKFEIREVNEADDSKVSMVWTFHGYEFFLDGKAVAAVQTLAKQYVWLRNDLDEKNKLILATAAAVMLFRDL